MKLVRQIAHSSLPWRIVAFLTALLVLWAPVALIVYGAGYLLGRHQFFGILALVALYGGFIGLSWCWGRWVHRRQRPFYAYGLVFCPRFATDALMALLLGCGLVGLLFTAQVLLGWADFYPRPIFAIALEGLAVGVGISIAEELLFRGWLLTELQTSLSRSHAIVWSSFIFALAHFIKPLSEVLSTSPQFLGLLLLGMILAASRHASYRQPVFTSLGWPIGLHGGLVWGYYIVDVGDLVIPSGRAPDWITGIHGNPLSGLLGLAILGFLTVFTWSKMR